MRKASFPIILLIFITLLLSACSDGGGSRGIGEDEDDRIIVLGFSQLGDESEWRTASTNDIKRAATSAGVQLMFDYAQQ